LNLRHLFLNHVAQTSDAPVGIQVKKARGIYITTLDGKKYIDLISGISVCNVGHRNDAVVKAIRDQSSKYLHTMVYGEHIQFPQVKLAQLLASLLPDTLNFTYFTNSGTEATEGAMKLAKRYTGRTNFVAMKNAYHGSTQGALSLMSDTYFSAAYRPLLPGVSFMDYNDMSQLDLINEHTAGVFVEIIQSEAGYIPGELDFLKALENKCKLTGALLIIDEIQTGIGRTGSLFAFETVGIVPDILLLAKGLGGGMPIGCFIADKKIMQVLSENPVLGHLTTFGGHPVSCAAAVATLNEISSKKLMEPIAKKEQLFRKHLVHPKIERITGKGLMLGIHLGSEQRVKEVIAICHENGVLIDWFLFNAKTLRLAPPLIIGNGEINKVCKIILKALDEAS
jgi:acetylornithine/N-succinyldiaminopimelate aminotransferase